MFLKRRRTRRRASRSLILVRLSKDQIERAKEVNGRRKQITHSLLCGPHGQIFGTETHCRKYYAVWKKIFPNLFPAHFETKTWEITDYETTFGLVERLIEAEEDPGSASV